MDIVVTKEKQMKCMPSRKKLAVHFQPVVFKQPVHDGRFLSSECNISQEMSQDENQSARFLKVKLPAF